ncbi:hypothetical protein [Qipengyuania marisflavi]|uniref:Uncharacterized protein n=1 Tax=Qipengyuania marisflavi TaxID=2486356 RepID=A0A5S3P8C3_9SPHN|nr:hypothetical protein [Qipengyuania marisflavi]TMM49744.1 hypothetical protein FEV51_00630 [Qipengyuania marisflavi]
MIADRISQALERIDRALAQIETQAALAKHAPASNSAADSDLAVRHDALRQSVTATIAELDTLIEGIDT